MKIGQKYRIKEDLISGGKYGGVILFPFMAKFKGNIVTISLIDGNRVGVKENPYMWHVRMLDPIKEKSYTMDDFINNKIVVNVKNKKEYNEFMKICESKGLVWVCGDKPTDLFFFDVYQKETLIFCEDHGLRFGTEVSVNNEKIISFTELADIKIGFTKENLKDNHIIVNRIGIKRVWKSTRGSEFNNDLTSKMSYKDYDIMEVWEFDKLVWKREEESILDDVEKEYLSGVIKPFKNRINYIRKDRTDKASHIVIEYDKEDVESGWTYCVQSINLPEFKKGTMYKNMKIGKEYTLEELGL